MNLSEVLKDWDDTARLIIMDMSKEELRSENGWHIFKSRIRRSGCVMNIPDSYGYWIKYVGGLSFTGHKSVEPTHDVETGERIQ